MTPRDWMYLGGLVAFLYLTRRDLAGIGGKQKKMIAEQILVHPAVATIEEKLKREFTESVRHLLS